MKRQPPHHTRLIIINNYIRKAMGCHHEAVSFIDNARVLSLTQIPNDLAGQKARRIDNTEKWNIQDRNERISPSEVPIVIHAQVPGCHRVIVIRSTDIAKISRKRSKPDKHGHGNGIECTRAGRMLSK
ncbi:hypothetical protein Tco_0580994, partial [Tanacetum coccineum]